MIGFLLDFNHGLYEDFNSSQKLTANKEKLEKIGQSYSRKNCDGQNAGQGQT